MPGQATSPVSLRLAPPTEKWLRRALAAASVGFILLFLYTALRRLHFPFSLDQVELSTVTSVWRIAHGYPLYTRPTTDFFPFLYAPLYFYLSAALTKLVGPGYVALRLISIAGALGCMAVIYSLIHAETRRRLPSLVGAGLFAACYHPLQAWYDIGRVDSLFLFFFLLAIYLTRRAPILLAVLVWLIAFQTKQIALPVAVLVICSDWQRPRRLLLGLISLIAGAGASVWFFNHHTGGWYSYYLFGSSAGLRWILRPAIFYIPVDLLLPLGLAFLIVLAALLFTPPTPSSRGTWFFAVTSFAIYASIWYLRAHDGSALNTLMPAYAWTAVLFGIALHRLSLWLVSQPSPHAQTCHLLLLSAALLQLVIFIYHPGRYLPSPGAAAARQSFEHQLAALPGDIYVLDHSYDAVLAGKQPHAVFDAFYVILASPPSPLRSAYIADFRRAIDSHQYSGFVLDAPAEAFHPGADWMPADFLRQYPVRILAEGGISGAFAQQPVEQWIYLPCSVLDHDTSAFITPDSVVSYGDCPNAPTRIPVQK